MNLRAKVERTFGKSAFDHGLFYSYKKALRFELSISGDSIEMFSVAYDKAMRIAKSSLECDSNLLLCWTFYGSKRYLSTLSAFKEFIDLGIRIPKSCESWLIQNRETEDYYRHFLLFELPPKLLRNAIWGALAQEIGIRPRIVGNIYIMDLVNQVLLHPYDDRGMDIVSANTELMTTLYTKYNNYLLDYDRAAMDKVYGNL